ncbi:hypothetical protein [Sorangium atrum]|uniref:Uncharacterized protein n=1 Tax=Sorangium atrum TaxID=2995308 RepID=A0ABT5BZL4_9BACT|nr:hypothetical protein [Sorangium aterium]MDC0679605.1 hypothetical protein [Sorangium aterium]
MPIVQINDPQQSAPTSCGVIIFRVDLQTGNVDGTFALALYEGELAREIGTRISPPTGDFAGAYSVTTLRPDGTTFAVGDMIARPLGQEGVYLVRWVLRPVELALEELGYVPGTQLIYEAIGMKLNGGAAVAVAWDNNVFARRWPQGSAPQ